MKIRASINEHALTTAEIAGKGHLGVHLNLHDERGSGAPKIDVMVSGYDTEMPEETKYLKWKGAALNPGDQLLIEIMPACDAEQPVEIKTSLKDRLIISAAPAEADKIIEAALSCNSLLDEMLQEMKPQLDADTFKKLAYGVGRVINEVFSSIAEPVYRAHPSKRPEIFKDEPL